jgi:hypothetical protein
MPTPALRAHLNDHQAAQRARHRPHHRRGLPDPAHTVGAITLAICEIEAGLRPASQLERLCHPSLWDAVATRIRRAGGPPVHAASLLRVRAQELTPGLVDAVAIIRRGPRVAFVALRLEAIPGRWEVIELLY